MIDFITSEKGVKYIYTSGLMNFEPRCTVNVYICTQNMNMHADYMKPSFIIPHKYNVSLHDKYCNYCLILYSKRLTFEHYHNCTRNALKDEC